MQVVGEGAAQQRIVLRGESRGNPAGIGATPGGGQAIELCGEHFARSRCGDFKIGDEEDKLQPRCNLESGDLHAARDRETTEGGGRGIVGMALELGANLEEGFRVQRAPGQFILPWSSPRRTVTLLPSPREAGTSPEIFQEKRRGEMPAPAKNRSATADTMEWFAEDPPRRTVR